MVWHQAKRPGADKGFCDPRVYFPLIFYAPNMQSGLSISAYDCGLQDFTRCSSAASDQPLQSSMGRNSVESPKNRLPYLPRHLRYLLATKPSAPIGAPAPHDGTSHMIFMKSSRDLVPRSISFSSTSAATSSWHVIVFSYPAASVRSIPPTMKSRATA